MFLSNSPWRPRSLKPTLLRAFLSAILFCLLTVAGGGCGAVGNTVLGTVGATAVGAYSPAQEIEQVYYLGVFDPHEQVQPQQVYRVTVHGQASFISQMKFGSGWVPASVIDSLNSSASIPDGGDRPTLAAGEKTGLASLKTGRRLVMFGPEGFREAPADYRLVIVMGSSPEAFFKAIDSSIGVISQVRREQSNPQVVQQLVQARGQLDAEQQRLSDLNNDLSVLPASAAKGS